MKLNRLMMALLVIANCFFEGQGLAEIAIDKKTNQLVYGTISKPKIIFTPSVLINNKWFKTKPCLFQKVGHLKCDVNDFGFLVIEQEGAEVATFFQAKRKIVFGGVNFNAILNDSPYKIMLSQGFHSWSNSGWIRIPYSNQLELSPSPVTAINDERRHGDENSWEVTILSSTSSHFLIGVTSATEFKSRIELKMIDNSRDLSIKLVSGDTGDKIDLKSGQKFVMDNWYLNDGAHINPVVKDYTKRLQSFNRNYNLQQKIIGWNSWYEFWQFVDEKDIRYHLKHASPWVNNIFQSSTLAKNNTKFALIIDDGWADDWGAWNRNEEKFPTHFNSLTQEIKEKGLVPGIWLAPLLVRQGSSLTEKNPSWFLTEHIYEHPTGKFKILDVTHPGVQIHLKKLIKAMVGFGFEYLKLDFLFLGAYEGQRHQNVTGMQAYNLAMQMIREAAGDDIYILACGSPSIASFPYVNSWRLGADIGFMVPALFRGPSWTDVTKQARSLSARWLYCDLVDCDNDPWLMRSPHTKSSAEAAGWVAAMGGGGLFWSDSHEKISDQRKKWQFSSDIIRIALSGQGAQPAIPYLMDAPPKLGEPSIWDRIIDRDRLWAPPVWLIPGGGKLLINFNDVAINLDGNIVEPRSSIYLDTVLEK